MAAKKRDEKCPHAPFDIQKEECLDCGEVDFEKYRRCHPDLKKMPLGSKDQMEEGFPEFSAEDVNLLYNLSRKKTYYEKAYLYVKKFLDGAVKPDAGGRRWLFGIKADLESIQGE